jgi:hypothetical protein
MSAISFRPKTDRSLLFLTEPLARTIGNWKRKEMGQPGPRICRIKHEGTFNHTAHIPFKMSY